LSSAFVLWAGGAITLCGAVFCLIGALGLLRLPDVYARMHAASVVDTLGMLLLVLGMLVIEGFSQNALKLLMIAVFVLFTTPVAAHALSRAALREFEPQLDSKNEDAAEPP